MNVANVDALEKVLVAIHATEAQIGLRFQAEILAAYGALMPSALTEKQTTQAWEAGADNVGHPKDGVWLYDPEAVRTELERIARGT